jgi:hypothetical protein
LNFLNGMPVSLATPRGRLANGAYRDDGVEVE